MTQGLMTGQVAMITGAGSGIGRAAALKFAAAGARVVLGDVTGAEDETAEMVRAAGGQAASLRMDAGQEPDVIAGIDLAQREFGRLDAVSANAGITGTTGGREFLEHTPEIGRAHV